MVVRILTVLLYVVPCSLTGLGQNALSNSWQMVVRPQFEEPTDKDAASDVLARAAQFDAFFSSHQQSLTDVSKPLTIVSPGSIGARAELPVSESDVIAVAKFDHSVAHLTPSHQVVYTEIAFVPTKIIFKSKVVDLVQDVLPVLEAGGSVETSDHTIYRTPVAPREYGPLPGHMYLVFLRYNPSGRFFELIKSWDISSGMAVANSSEDVSRAREKRSLYSGMPESSFLQSVENKVKNR